MFKNVYNNKNMEITCFKIMNKINRNAPCPCGSGKKYKRCCGAENVSPLHGMTPGIRMKGGICYDNDLQAFIPIVHIWGNIHE